MTEGRRVLQLLIRRQPSAVNPIRLMVRSSASCRPFLPHLHSVWSRMFRPSTGGPSLVSLANLPRRPRRKRTVR